MLSEQVNIFEYEEVLMGKRKNFLCSFKGTERENCIEVGNIWRYAVTRILRWSPEEALRYLTTDIVETLCLDKTFSGINFLPGNKYFPDYGFILQYAFPNQIKYDFKKETLTEYQHVAKLGVWTHDTGKYRYPKKFFVGVEGIQRAEFLLQYVVSMYLSHMTLTEQYDFFADTQKALKWLAKKKLDVPVKLMYNESPLEYFHYSLEYKEKNVLYYWAKTATAKCKNSIEQLSEV